MIALLLALLPQIQASGLEPGERFGEIAPAQREAPGAPIDPDVRAAATRHGRVVDAFTGRPVVGAKIESWTEELDAHFGGFARIGEARSGLDGRFSIAVRQGASVADKGRVSAPGYLTLSVTDGDLGDVLALFPAPAEPTRIRALDSRDRPIAGVRFTSTMTCTHDVPAFDALTDARGVVELHEFGLQSDVPELRVRAPGRVAIRYLDGEPALLQTDPRVPWTLHLPRQRPVLARLFDREGAPLVHAPIYAIDGECYHVVRTDGEGWMEVPARYDHGEIVLSILDEPRNLHLYSYWPPAARSVTLRPDADEWPEGIQTGEIKVRSPQELAVELPLHWRVPVQLFHEEGWSQQFSLPEPNRAGIAFPAGRGFFLFGGPFSGWEEELIEFELAPGGELVLELQARRQPRISVLAPDSEWHTLWIEAGDATYEDAPLGEPVPVAAGQPLCIFLESEGPPRRAFVDEAVDGMVIDLRSDSTRLFVPPPAQQLRRVEVRVTGETAGRRGSLSVWSPDPACDLAPVQPTTPGRFAVEGPAGAPFLLAYDREGCAWTCWGRGRLPARGEPIEPLRLAPVELAALEILADFDFELPVLGWLELDELHPGPLNLVIERSDGRRYALELELAPGARRVVELRE